MVKFGLPVLVRKFVMVQIPPGLLEFGLNCLIFILQLVVPSLQYNDLLQKLYRFLLQLFNDVPSLLPGNLICKLLELSLMHLDQILNPSLTFCLDLFLLPLACSHDLLFLLQKYVLELVYLTTQLKCLIL